MFGTTAMTGTNQWEVGHSIERMNLKTWKMNPLETETNRQLEV